MIAEQLQAARSAHWRQNQNPLLTLDDAQSYLQQHPLCLYLPRHGQLPAPAPSFVEACVGMRQATPGAEAMEHAQSLLIRLVSAGTVVPLNLLGTVSEQPDFLAHTDALPFVVSLRADADWKHAPQKSSGHKVSPLVLELWKALEKDGSLTASEARETLGRELTEAAVLRGLCELWQTLRISPVFSTAAEPARWEMLRVRHRAALTTAGNTGQVTAISLLVSMYLQSVYAASSDEIEIFLSPVTSRSRVREAVRGLAATRQIHSLSMDAQTYYFLEGGLPEFAEVPGVAVVELPAPIEHRRPMPVPRKVQATRAASSPPASASATGPASASEPIFRRPKTAVQPAMPPAAKPEVPPFRRPATRAAAESPGGPAWKPAAKPYARRADAPAKKGDQRPPFRPKQPFSPTERRPGVRSEVGPRPARTLGPQRPAGSPSRAPRPPYARPDTRPNTRSTYARPSAGGAPRGDGPRQDRSRPGARPAARSGPWTGAAKGDAPKPWALPGRKSAGPPRPPRPGGRSETPFRPRPPRSKPAAGDARAARPAPGSGRPRQGATASPYRANRPAGSAPSYRRNDRPPTGGQDRRPEAAPRSSRPGGPRPPGSAASGRPFTPRSGPPNTGRSGPPRGGPGPRPNAGPRPASGSSSRPPFKARPRPGARPGPEGAGKAPRLPFVPGGSPRKPGFSRPGGSAGKPGKPSANFRDRKPGRKKPGA